MAVDQGRANPHDGPVPVSEQLREIFGHATQMEISAHLKANGLREASQSTVSAWLRDRVPSLDQLAKIEDIYGVQRGTVLTKAGYIDGGVLGDQRKRRPAAPPNDIAKVLELARSMREGLEKSQSRDDKLSDIINLCEKISATQSALVCRVLENAVRIEALLEHFDLEVDLEPSPSA